MSGGGKSGRGVPRESLVPLAASVVVLALFATGHGKACAAAIALAAAVALFWVKPAESLLLLLLCFPFAPKFPLSIGNLYASTALVLAYLAVFVVRKLASPEPIRFRRTPLALPGLFFLSTLVLSLSQNLHLLLGNPARLLQLAQFVFYFSLFYMVWDLDLSRRMKRAIVLVVFFAAVVEGSIGCVQWAMRTGWFVTGTLDHEHNHLAAYIVFAGLLLLGLLLDGRFRPRRLLSLLPLAAMGGALVFSFSRSGYVAAGLGLTAFLFLPLRRRTKLWFASLLLVFGAAAYRFVPESAAHRFGTLATIAARPATEDISFSSRLGQWGEAWESFRRNPVIGAGAMTFRMRDNYFMKTLGETGALGILGLSWLLAVLFREEFRGMRQRVEDRFLHGARIGLIPASFALLIVFNLAGDFLNVHRVMGGFWVVLAALLPDPPKGIDSEPS